MEAGVGAMAVANSSSALSFTGIVSVLEPTDVRTSDPEPDTNGWKAVDGNPETYLARPGGCPRLVARAGV